MQWNTVFFVCFVFYTASISNAQQQSSEPQRSRVLNVVTIPNPPYTFVLPGDCEGNACFEGYAIDLIKELSKILGFQYRIKLSDDRRYGMQSNGTWHGMIGEVADGRADLAVADLTITSKREEAVDFSYPFMTTGISILYKRPSVPQAHKLKSPIAIWFYCLITFIMITLFMMKRRRSSQTKDNLIYREFGGSVGCTTKSFICSWKLFTFLMVTLSFGSVAMFISRNQNTVIYQFESAEDLSLQTQIRYGTVASGSTRSFFEQSTVPTYAKLWKGMNSNTGNFVNSTREGIERVRRGNYAFFMEAAAIDYIIERDNDFLQVGGLLDSKAYGIAMKKGSYMKKIIDNAILQMQESGVLQTLHHRWWRSTKPSGHQYERKTPIECQALSLVGYAAGLSGVLLLLCACIELLSFFWQKFFEVKH